MKKISYYLIFIVIAGLVLVSFWTYQKYFQKQEPNLLLFEVEKGDIQEVVRVRGEVVSQKEFDLKFPFSGVVEKVFVREGQEIDRGDVLMKLETIDHEIEIKRLTALLNQNKAALDKLTAGAVKEEIKVLETKVLNAETDLANQKQSLKDTQAQAVEDLDTALESALNTLEDAYLKAYNAQNKLDSIQRSYFTRGDEEGILVRENEDKLIAAVSEIKSRLDTARADESSENIDSALSITKNKLSDIYEFLSVIRAICEDNDYRDTVSSADKTFLDTDKANINTALTNVVDDQQTISSTKLTNEININLAKTEVDSAAGLLKTAQDQLDLKKAPARAEDIEIAQAKIKETESQIEKTQEKISKSFLYAPVSAKIVEIWLEQKEIFESTKTAISLSTIGHKIQADISELEIGKVKEEVDSNNVSIIFDAFTEQEFKGKVISIEPREIVKEGDKYYRANIYFEENGELIRSGMSADLAIIASSKKDVLKIPEFIIYEKDSKKFVKILEGNSQKEVEIETGISDGESIEVVKGLNFGQTVVVSAD